MSEVKGTEYKSALEHGVVMGQTYNDAARRLMELSKDGVVPFMVIPDGWQKHSVEQYLPHPVRKKGNEQFTTVKSFVRYVNEHKQDGTRLYRNKLEVMAQFDGHTKTHAGWGDHRAFLRPTITEEWQRWTDKDRRKMSQGEFAAFIEDNLLQIVSPKGAEMLEIALRFEATKGVRFTKGVRLQDGNQELVYEETTEAKAGTKGHLLIPPSFKLGLAVLDGTVPWEVEARFRYRIADASLQLWYELVNPHLVVKAVWDDLVKQIEAQTQLEVYQ